MNFSFGNLNNNRDISLQIQQGIKLILSFDGSNSSLGEQRQTQVYRRGIQGINGNVEFKPPILILIKMSYSLSQTLH